MTDIDQLSRQRRLSGIPQMGRKFGCVWALFVFSHPIVFRYASNTALRWFRAWAADDPKEAGNLIYRIMAGSRNAFLVRVLLTELLGLPIEVIESPLFKNWFDVTGVPGANVSEKVSNCIWALLACTNQSA